MATHSSQTLTIYTDGGALGNPGPAASAYRILDSNGKPIEERGVAIGETTNNIAEFMAVKIVLERVVQLMSEDKISQPTQINFISDSTLVVGVLSGKFKTKHENTIRMKQEVGEAMNKLFGTSFTFTHVLREKNSEADALVKKAMGR